MLIRRAEACLLGSEKANGGPRRRPKKTTVKGCRYR